MLATMDPPAIALRGLRRDYNDRPVLHEVSVEVGTGRTLAVLGPNGAGKTTLLRILATLLRPSAGEASVLGAPLPRQAWRVRGRIGYLGHQPLLYRDLSVRENLRSTPACIPWRRPGRGSPSCSARRPGPARRRAGPKPLGRDGAAGWRSAAAVLHRPDAAAARRAALAPRRRRAAGSSTTLIGPEPGRTRVVVSHDVEAAVERADQVLLLAGDGTPVHAGPAADLAAADLRSVYSGAVR